MFRCVIGSLSFHFGIFSIGPVVIVFYGEVTHRLSNMDQPHAKPPSFAHPRS